MITSPGQLKVGMMIFQVHAFSEADKRNMCSITKSKVIKFPVTAPASGNSNFIRLFDANSYLKIDFDNNLWVTKDHISVGREHEDSMQDMGIIPNKYNRHNAFDNLSEAKRYMCATLSLKITDAATNNYNRAMAVLDLD